MKRSALVLYFVLAMSAAAYAQQGTDADLMKAIDALPWIEGPQTVSLFGIASLEIPPGYQFLNPEGTRQFQVLAQNPPAGVTYLLAPADLHWTGYFRFSEDGYVRDDERIDASQVLASIREGTARGNEERRRRGWPELSVLGWRLPPFYDGETKRLEWAINAALTDSGQADSTVVNLNTRVLGRRGVTSVTLVSDPEDFAAATREFKSALATYRYSESERYAAFRQGDKIAEYGLAALVTGGAAAVATKTGFWKVLLASLAAAWKLVAAAVVAALGFIRNLFRREKRER